MGWRIRDGTALDGVYDPLSGYYTIKMYRGGDFQCFNDEKFYVGGKVSFIDFCHSDEILLLEFEIMARELGYLHRPIFLYKIDGFDLEVGLVELKSDIDALNLHKFVNEQRIVDVYMKPVTNETVEIVVEQENFTDFNNSGSDGSFKGSDPDFNDSDYNDLTDDDDEIFSNYVDKDVEWGGVDVADVEVGDGSKGKGKNVENVDKGKGKIVENLDDGYETDYGGSNELLSDCSVSDDDGNSVKKPKFAIFNPQSDMEDPKFKLGMLFDSAKVFREAIRHYATKNGKQIKFPINEKDKVRAVCKEGCQWVLYASKLKGEHTMQVKTLIDSHSCNRSFDITHANSRWVAKNYMELIRSNPTWPVQSLIETVQRDFHVNVSKYQIYRAKNKAMELIEGTSKEQFSQLWDYINECRRANPGSTIIMKASVSGEESEEPVFKRLYVCWGAMKKGFLHHCRPLVGVDGCHLKGPHGGILLTAVGIDGNNQIYPLAYALVEKETKSSWRWFFELLEKDLLFGNQFVYSIISDQQKGLVPAMEEVFPNVSHRFCVRHMYSNFRDEHKGVALKNLLWKAARATKVSTFEAAMLEIKTIKESAYEWLCDRPAARWSRSHFNTLCKSDMLLNNICECFNANILDARDKPIITMLEKIRINLMERIHKKRDKIKKCEGLLCPAIEKIVDDNKLESGNWIPKWNGDQQFEVSGPYGEQLKVDVGEKTCGCRKWELTGIPCAHAISALNYLAEDVEKYVSKYYMRETFLQTYGNLLNPINGRDLWKQTGLTPVLPPNYSRQPGRPKKNRNKKNDEKKDNPHKLGKKGVKMTCTLCGSSAHNRRRCTKSSTNPPARQKLPVRANRGGHNTSTKRPSHESCGPVPIVWHGSKRFRKNSNTTP